MSFPIQIYVEVVLNKSSIYDLIGCNYNAPAAYVPGTFLSCEGDLQDEVGTYTSSGTGEYRCSISVLDATYSFVSLHLVATQ